MYNAGLPCPQPFLLRSHVLLMDFIGDDGWPAKLLKDVEQLDNVDEEYAHVCILMWRMYNQCKLVHADLSEFNMLLVVKMYLFI